MKLYSGPLSLFSRKVEIALREKGLPFDREMVPFTQAKGYSPKHPAVLAANPKGQVPVLIDGDLTIFDSTVIFEYLEEAYPQAPLYPASPRDRARCRLLELTADEILLPPLRSLMTRTSPPDPDPDRQRQRMAEADRGEIQLRDHYETLSRRLGSQDHFCGERFTVADIALFMTILWVQRLKGPKLDKHPNLAAWYSRVKSRPSAGQAAAEIAAADRELSPPL
ncbi:MAG TPA: glutathione S-transferase family protein [Hypericibacter adhaerens]|jgi:glutathione S-transferase|uniref:Glutathione S-transferase n=1 Tax=Hypericibacter adhaerens TaxID=2602016 RepID=A0A5J6MSJ6_9PROT|nr:glutathione S-transferase family protein [Hypericibacter adhaerens]QEX20548.1 glutathione S-transferase [Hypericibacter adhaerens]HWA44401.1 glutathione S-transferase family protein [Hypericibacter adhaerens]